MNFPRFILKWSIATTLIGVLSGSVSALFLYTLDVVTRFREAHLWIIALLPIAGFGIGAMYFYFGRQVERGTNLIIDEIHEPSRLVPKRMAPLIFLGTIFTHLFGGSAGREGTAVQMGAALADRLKGLFKNASFDRRIFLMAGMSAGFGSVFGTPLAGGLFGLEVLSLRKFRLDAILPCFIASAIANQVTLRWGIHHTLYSVGEVPRPSLLLLAAVAGAGACFGLIGRLFSFSVHGVAKFFRRLSYAPLRPMLGGVGVALAVYFMGSTRFIGLGIPGIVSAFDGTSGSYDFLWKFLFTVVTLGTGFKGGEVTPLFFIGATLGATLAKFLPLPFSTLSGVGFVAVFAGTANTPITCTVMAMELFGAPIGLFAAFACIVSSLFSGKVSIYARSTSSN